MEKRWRGAAFAVALLATAPAVSEPSAAVPPDPYVLRGYVPAGFSGFGKWTALRATPFYATVGSRKPSGAIEPCEAVTAQDGQVRGHPREIRVLKAHPPFRQGERIWILARDLEEGYFQLWYRGAIRDDLLDSLGDGLAMAEEHCSICTPECWLRIEQDSPQEHWVRIRRKSGSVGWIKDVKDFSEDQVSECR
ncbi:MAG TPA: hypothetical protein VER96_17920 [Polyangiaceae bacterium]|nr:hypothetical protein [Polyangiaceae bacterium]